MNIITLVLPFPLDFKKIIEELPKLPDPPVVSIAPVQELVKPPRPLYRDLVYIPNIPNARRYKSISGAQEAYNTYQAKLKGVSLKEYEKTAYKIQTSRTHFPTDIDIELDGTLINEIAYKYATGKYTQEELGIMFKVTTSTVCTYLGKYRKKRLEESTLKYKEEHK